MSEGLLQLKKSKFAQDIAPLDSSCSCPVCKQYTRAYLHTVAGREPVGCHLLTIHNVSYMICLMRAIRTALADGVFPEFVRAFIAKQFPAGDAPFWVVEALRAAGIEIKSSHTAAEPKKQSGATSKPAHKPSERNKNKNKTKEKKEGKGKESHEHHHKRGEGEQKHQSKKEKRKEKGKAAAGKTEEHGSSAAAGAHHGHGSVSAPASASSLAAAKPS